MTGFYAAPDLVECIFCDEETGRVAEKQRDRYLSRPLLILTILRNKSVPLTKINYVVAAMLKNRPTMTFSISYIQLCDIFVFELRNIACTA